MSVGCLIPKGFYISLFFTTLGPIFFAAVFFAVTKLQLRKLSSEKEREELKSSRFSLFLGGTYLVFAGTSTAAFTTFLCKTYGDDETRYLIADRSIDCDSADHRLVQVYSGFMILLYPIGTTVLYAVQLNRYKLAIMDGDTREDNPEIQHLSFLWADYQPEYWWFEVFENIRRLSLTGMLVWFSPGSTGQLIAAMLLALASLKVYTLCLPFNKLDENVLAEGSQW